MKNFLMILFTTVCINFTANAQYPQCTTNDGRWTCIETSSGAIYSINDNANKICYVIEIKHGNGCDYMRVQGVSEWERVEALASKAVIKKGFTQVLQKVVGRAAAGVIGGAIVTIFTIEPAY